MVPVPVGEKMPDQHPVRSEPFDLRREAEGTIRLEQRPARIALHDDQNDVARNVG